MRPGGLTHPNPAPRQLQNESSICPALAQRQNSRRRAAGARSNRLPGGMALWERFLPAAMALCKGFGEDRKMDGACEETLSVEHSRFGIPAPPDHPGRMQRGHQYRVLGGLPARLSNPLHRRQHLLSSDAPRRRRSPRSKHYACPGDLRVLASGTAVEVAVCWEGFGEGVWRERI